MPFIKSSTAESDLTEWFVYGRDADKREIRFLIARLSPGKEYEIERRHTGRKGELRYRKGEVILPQDHDVDLASGIEKAVYALRDSDNCVVIPQDKESADAYAEAMGVSVEPEKMLTLDGAWDRRDSRGRYPLKELFLSDELIVARRIVAKAKKLGVQAIEEEEEGKGDSSPS